MRTPLFLSVLTSIFVMLPISGDAQTPQPLPTPPSDFDSKAKTPLNLPQTLEIPKNIRIEVNVWRKKPIHYPAPPDPNSLDNMMDPDLEGAVIERGEEDVHATFNWQFGRSSEAYIIHGFCYRETNLAYPNLVVPSKSALNFWLNRQNMSGGTPEDFPGITSYAPSNFVGTASLNGTTVLVFAADGIKPGTDTYPEANSVCLDPKTHFPLYLDDGIRVFTFTYSPESNVQINPQGPYLEAIKKFAP